jgi:hypothetical protein
MAKYTPLLVSLQGKLGALVYDKRLHVRQYVYSGTGGSLPVQCAFANLTKQWPASSVAYKTLCAALPRKGMPDGGLARLVPGVVWAATATVPLERDTHETLLSDMIEEQRGKFGSRFQWHHLEPHAVMLENRFFFYLYWDGLVPGEHAHWYAYLLMPATLSCAGHTEGNLFAPWLGVVCAPYPVWDPIWGYFVNDSRHAGVTLPAGRYYFQVVTYYFDEVLGDLVIDGCSESTHVMWTPP